jgi:hypothetical protein
MAQDYDTVRPYTPVEILENGSSTSVSALRLGILNRNISVSKMGLPDAITVARPATQHGTLPPKISNLLLSPFKLVVVPTGGGGALTFEPTGEPQVRRDGDGKVSWFALSSATSTVDANVAANISMSLEMEGHMEAEIALSVDTLLSVADIQLSVGISAVQQMGMECRGSRLTGPGAVDSGLNCMNRSVACMNCSVPRTWRWSSKPTSQLWAGSAEAGLRLFLKASPDGSSDRNGATALRPPAWGAAGGGGARLDHAPGGLNFTAFTGPQTIGRAAAPLRLFLDMVVTPFKTRNETDHWSSRYYQVHRLVLGVQSFNRTE